MAASVYSEAIGVEPIVKRVEKARNFPDAEVLLAGSHAKVMDSLERGMKAILEIRSTGK